MQQRDLGASGVRVSALGLGTMNFGSDWHGSGAVDEKTADRLLGLALDRGVTLIDTADVYGRGAAETLLGKLLEGRRDRVVLATKVCGVMVPGKPSSGGLSRRHIREGLDASLRRLKTDRVDLYMAHAPDPDTPLEESLAAFEKAREQGKVRAIGCSNFSGAEVAAARGRFSFNQVQYSLAARFIEGDLLNSGVALMAWSPLGGGFLTGKYRPGAPRPDGRRRDPQAAFPPLPEGRLEGLVRVLDQVAALEGLTPAQTALGWTLSKPWLSCAIVGARSASQLEETLGARPLSPKAAAFLDRASGVQA
jgi:aryl-alcohol dehydrogenase-like predicted oxidoreductase